MNPFVQQIRNLGPARLAAMGGVAFGMIAFIIFFATRFSAPQLELLYGDLSATDAREIIRQLESTGVPFRTENNGTQIMVASEQVTSIRMQMAEQGIPSGGSMGYELFDSMDALGTTNFVQNIN
ncbi:MAG: flagellar M-ring protein FliF, partial [Alphaproteobacteria bacterium]|nr:flagellar M-ring protein FliF [Alphaproteobacteria bacterium]